MGVIYFLVNVLVGFLLGLTAFVGDTLVDWNRHSSVNKAICDNLTHAMIGVFTWFNVNVYVGRTRIFVLRVIAQSLLCGLISSAIDIDHFISAQSIHLKDATNLSKRPFLHSTTLPVAVFPVLIVLSYFLRSYNLETFAWIFIASFISHHIRDAARRGFWLWPFGSTSPIGSKLYIFLSVVLPSVIGRGVRLSSLSLWKLESDWSPSQV